MQFFIFLNFEIWKTASPPEATGESSFRGEGYIHTKNYHYDNHDNNKDDYVLSVRLVVQDIVRSQDEEVNLYRYRNQLPSSSHPPYSRDQISDRTPYSSLLMKDPRAKSETGKDEDLSLSGIRNGGNSLLGMKKHHPQHPSHNYHPHLHLEASSSPSSSSPSTTLDREGVLLMHHHHPPPLSSHQSFDELKEQSNHLNHHHHHQETHHHLSHFHNLPPLLPGSVTTFPGSGLHHKQQSQHIYEDVVDVKGPLPMAPVSGVLDTGSTGLKVRGV